METVVAVIYDPVADAWARVVQEGRWWVAQCQGKQQVAWNEAEAVGWAERMLGRVAKRRRG